MNVVRASNKTESEMKNKKYLPLYRQWATNNMLPGRNGLCNEFGVWISAKDKFDFSENPLFLLLTPRPYIDGVTNFWASDEGSEWYFNPLRQNIVLLMACLNDEL